MTHDAGYTTDGRQRRAAALLILFVINFVIMLVLRLISRSLGWWEGPTGEILLFSALWAAAMVIFDVVMTRIRRRRATGGEVRHNGEHE